MVATPHALAGAFAARFARTPRGALAAGVISHLALDRIPHTDYRLANRKALVAELRTGLRLTLPLHHANHTSIEPPVAIRVLTQLITAAVLLTRFQRP